MLLAPGYSYKISVGEEKVKIELVETSTGKTKEFSLAKQDSQTGLHSHMNSLTEEQCGSWFRKRKE